MLRNKANAELSELLRVRAVFALDRGFAEVLAVFALD
jgi:hypothetical protein